MDTNILLRLMVRDDPAQTAVAIAIAREPIFITDTVFVELAWVLQSIYGFDDSRLAAALNALLDLPTVMVDHEPGLRWALRQLHSKRADIADMIHLVAARRLSSFATFDREIARRAGGTPPVPVETLTV